MQAKWLPKTLTKTATEPDFLNFLKNPYPRTFFSPLFLDREDGEGREGEKY